LTPCEAVDGSAARMGGSAVGLARAAALARMRWTTHASRQRARRQTKAAPSIVGARRLVAWHDRQHASVGRTLLRRRGSMALYLGVLVALLLHK
jgi:hypothetical protein